MYKGDNDNETQNYVTVPDDDYRIWIADEAVRADEVAFHPTMTCFWDVGLGLQGMDNKVEWFVGGWNPDTDMFYDDSNDGDGDNGKLTLQDGHYLAVVILDMDSNNYDVDVRVTWTLYPPYVGTYVSWTCDTPPYPVPDTAAWIMFAVGSIVLGLIGWKYIKRTSNHKRSAQDV